MCAEIWKLRMDIFQRDERASASQYRKSPIYTSIFSHPPLRLFSSSQERSYAKILTRCQYHGLKRISTAYAYARETGLSCLLIPELSRSIIAYARENHYYWRLSCITACCSGFSLSKGVLSPQSSHAFLVFVLSLRPAFDFMI